LGTRQPGFHRGHEPPETSIKLFRYDMLDGKIVKQIDLDSNVALLGVMGS
jgi:hypothetical protein